LYINYPKKKKTYKSHPFFRGQPYLGGGTNIGGEEEEEEEEEEKEEEEEFARFFKGAGRNVGGAGAIPCVFVGAEIPCDPDEFDTL
jgi:hypothetical protein